MAVVVIQEFEATREEYDQVTEKLGDATPAGAILHAASLTNDPLPRLKEMNRWLSSWRWRCR
jgi:hypothetical protein